MEFQVKYLSLFLLFSVIEAISLVKNGTMQLLLYNYFISFTDSHCLLQPQYLVTSDKTPSEETKKLDNISDKRMITF